MLATFVFGQRQRLLVQRSPADSVAKDALRGVTGIQATEELAIWKKQHIGAEITLAEAGVAHQLSLCFTLEDLDQASAKLPSTAFATIWTAAHDHVTRRHGLGHV
jgi:hypothetical protein